MSPRTGRPRLENPKRYRAEVRLDQYERDLLEQVMELTGRSASDILKAGIYSEAKACGLRVKPIKRLEENT